MSSNGEGEEELEMPLWLRLSLSLRWNETPGELRIQGEDLTVRSFPYNKFPNLKNRCLRGFLSCGALFVIPRLGKLRRVRLIRTWVTESSFFRIAEKP